MTKTAVIGSGAWGTALAAHAARLGHDVTMWAIEPTVVEDIGERHRNDLYLPDVPLPDTIGATGSMREAATAAEMVLLVAPSKYLREVSTELAPHVPGEAIVVVASKGIEESSLELMSDVLSETMPDVGEERRVFLSGPSFAKEVARQMPTDVVVASRGEHAARTVQQWLHSPSFRVYTSADPVGVQVGGALKNVIAIATGAGDGLGFGHNARAALITRGLAEITRLGVKLGADPLTFLGMSGVGDLILTSTGDLSRNRTLGLEVARGADPRGYLESRRTVAEGFWTSAAAHDLALRHDVEMPITEQVYNVLHRGRPVPEAARILMNRHYKDELHGIREVWR